jgi:hypothetical protein
MRAPDVYCRVNYGFSNVSGHTSDHVYPKAMICVSEGEDPRNDAMVRSIGEAFQKMWAS